MEGDTDQELFTEAMSGETQADPPADAGTQAAEPDKGGGEEGKSGAKRDPATGRFAAAGEDGGKKTEATPPPAKAEGDAAAAGKQSADAGGDHRVPLSEHLSEREKRQAAERDRDEYRRQMEALNRRVDELSRPKREPEPAPDIWTDPNAYVRSQVEPVQAAQQAHFERVSRMIANDKFGKEAVDAAFNELQAEVRANPAMGLEAQRMMQSDHPYGELVAWHKNRQALKEIGTDPAAYRTKLEADLLASPEFRKKIIEAIKAEAAATPPAGQSRPNVIDLPPSLGRTRTAAANLPADGEDPGDAELFRTAMQRR